MSAPPRLGRLLSRLRRASRHGRFPFADFLREVAEDVSGLEPEELRQRAEPNLLVVEAIVSTWDGSSMQLPGDAVSRANRSLRGVWSHVKSEFGTDPSVLITDEVLCRAEELLREALREDIALVWRPWYQKHPKLKQAIRRAQQRPAQ